MLTRIAFLLLSVITSFFVPGKTAYAHERWFVEHGQHAGETFSFDAITALILVACLLGIGVAFKVDRSNWYRRIEASFDRYRASLPEGVEWRVVAFLAGAMLLATASMGVFLAPELVMPRRELLVPGQAVQAVAGLLLISQLSFLVPAFLLVALALPAAVIAFGPAAMVDYVFQFLALAVALGSFGIMAAAPIDRRICDRLAINPATLVHLPLPVIRVGTGLTLMVLTVHNKLISPDLTLTFLDRHDLNFMAALGLSPFTNLHFVFLAGVVELLVGLLLVLGIATRLVAGMLLMLLLTTMAVFGLNELVGHLPLLGIAALLVYRGAGKGIAVNRKVASLSAARLPVSSQP